MSSDDKQRGKVVHITFHSHLIYINQMGQKYKSDGTKIWIELFFSRFKKGSRPCRNILTVKPTLPYDTTTIKSFFALMAMPVPSCDTLMHAIPLWNINSLSNQFREFIFKFFNNKLGLNTRISHFVNSTRDCTFCAIENRPTTDESFSHLFFYCPTVLLIHDRIDATAFGITDRNLLAKKLRWTGSQDMRPDNKFVRLLHLAIQFFIWDSKLCKRLPNANWVLGEAIAMLDMSIKINRELKNDMLVSNYPLSRNWDLLAARRPWHPP